MTRILLLILVAAALLFWWHWKATDNPEERRKMLANALIWGLLAVVALLAATGRIHWLGAVFAAVLIAIKQIGLLLVRFFPILATIYQTRQRGGSPPAGPQSIMTIDEARNILGVQADASSADIRRAYKTQMQRLHPDHGGSPYFATKLNQARDMLLREGRDDRQSS